MLGGWAGAAGPPTQQKSPCLARRAEQFAIHASGNGCLSNRRAWIMVTDAPAAVAGPQRESLKQRAHVHRH